MENMLLKIRIAVLWIFLAVSMSASMILHFMAPGSIEEVMTGIMEGLTITSGVIIFFSLFWLIPMAMAFLSVTFQDRLNRKMNIILGVIFTIFYIGHLLMHLMRGELPLDHLIMCLLMIVLPTLILWYAIKWPVGQR